MKKTIATVLIIVILISFIPNMSLAEKRSDAYDDTKTESEAVPEITFEEFENLSEKGEVSYAGQSAFPKGTPSFGSSIATLLSQVLTIFPKVASLLMTSIIQSETIANEYKVTPDGPFTIENLVFGMIEFFDANYFRYNSNKLNKSLKQNVQTGYVTARVLAIGISLVTLIYTGIRMAISTVSSDKAKYKKMLTNWIYGFVMLFVLHYIIILFSNLSASLTHLFTANAQQITIEEEILAARERNMAYNNGWSFTAEVILYTILVFYELRFFLMYFKRLLVIGFLIVISPIMTVTYALDKAGDNKAQAFSMWIKEIAVNIFIQPFHAFFYMVFIYSAGEIAKASPIVAIFFFMALSRGEKIVKGVFGLRGLQTINSISEYAKLRRGG